MSVGLRNPCIDLLRGVSILLVLLNHFNIAYRLSDTSLGNIAGWNGIVAVARNGNYGVTMFFVISGYLITANAMRRWPELGAIDAMAFYRLRIARIVPCLLLVVLIVDVLAFGGVTIFGNHAPKDIVVTLWTVNLAALTFWMNVLIDHYGWVNYPLGVLWSLSVEELFYLSFPLLCLTLRSPGRLLAFWCAIIAIGPIWRLLHQGDEAEFLYAYFASFDGIAIGCCTAVLAERLAPPIRLQPVVQSGIVAAMATLYLSRPIKDTNVLGVTAMAIGTAALLFLNRAPTFRASGILARAAAPVGWLGKHSYELYLFHLIVLGLFRTALPRSFVAADQKLILLAAFLCVSAIVAAAVARWVRRSAEQADSPAAWQDGARHPGRLMQQEPTRSLARWL